MRFSNIEMALKVCAWNVTVSSNEEVPAKCSRYCKILEAIREKEEVIVSIFKAGLLNLQPETEDATTYTTTHNSRPSAFQDLPICNYHGQGLKTNCWNQQITEWGLCYTNFLGIQNAKPSNSNFGAVDISFTLAHFACT